MATILAIVFEALLYADINNKMQMFGAAIQSNRGPVSSSPFPSRPRINPLLTSSASGTGFVVYYHYFPSGFGLVMFSTILILLGCIFQYNAGEKVKEAKKQDEKQKKLEALERMDDHRCIKLTHV